MNAEELIRKLARLKYYGRHVYSDTVRTQSHDLLMRLILEAREVVKQFQQEECENG